MFCSRRALPVLTRSGTPWSKGLQPVTCTKGKYALRCSRAMMSVGVIRSARACGALLLRQAQHQRRKTHENLCSTSFVSRGKRAVARRLGLRGVSATSASRCSGRCMRPRIYFAPTPPPLRRGANLPSWIYPAPAPAPLRPRANLPSLIYPAPAPPPLRHSLIAVGRETLCLHRPPSGADPGRRC